VPYLRGRVGPFAVAAPPARADQADRAEPAGPAGGEIPAEGLIDDEALFLATVRTTGAGRGAPDDAVATSLFVQAYAYRVAGTTLACAAVAGAAPDPSAGNVAVGLARYRPSSVTYATDDVVVVPPAGPADELDRRLFAGHLDPLVAAAHARVRVTERLLWGDVAAAVVAAARAVAGGSDDPAPVWRWFDAWLAAAPHDLAALGAGGAADYRRRTCCLWWKASGGGLCADCSLDQVPAPATDAGVAPAATAVRPAPATDTDRAPAPATEGARP
jgi:hypothetical protein